MTTSNKFNLYLSPLPFTYPRTNASLSCTDNNGFKKIALRATEISTSNEDGDIRRKEWIAVAVQPF